MLDEVMVTLAAGEVAPLVIGDVYCSAIEGCSELYDVRRAREWTGILTRWCDAQPELVPYRGQCLVHRSELLQLSGDWKAAMEQADLARAQLSRPTIQLALGAACYQQGELHRLRGEFIQAEEVYALATQYGREPQPGLALLRLAQHRPEAAAIICQRVVSEAVDRADRSRVLPALVEIMLAIKELDTARLAAEELIADASELPGPLLDATAAVAMGRVLLAEGDAHGALAVLRRAFAAWTALDAPYKAARARVLIATACASLGDDDTARLELETARRIFGDIGAMVDLQALAPPSRQAQLLTGREVEVLRLVARGLTNRAIGTELVLSERTVERHLSNIFTKLQVSTRSAATAYAFEHGLT